MPDTTDTSYVLIRSPENPEKFLLLPLASAVELEAPDLNPDDPNSFTAKLEAEGASILGMIG
jgi:CDP-diacylglycerol pyrophosphatase